VLAIVTRLAEMNLIWYHEVGWNCDPTFNTIATLLPRAAPIAPGPLPESACRTLP
jgi:hypothetical protein